MRAAELLRLLLGLCAGLTQLRRGHGARHAVYWNSSNPKFLREEYALQVDLNDYLEVLCPHYEARVPLEDTESFVLYMVEKDKYRGCYDTIGASKRWECNRPHAPYGPIKFLEKIQKFTPFSLGFEFQAGKEYYYFSIPDVDSIGDCLKLRVSVCCRPTTQRPVTEVPRSQPRGGLPGGGDPQRQGRSSASRPHLSWLLPRLLPLMLSLCFLFAWV